MILRDQLVATVGAGKETRIIGLLYETLISGVQSTLRVDRHVLLMVVENWSVEIQVDGLTLGLSLILEGRRRRLLLRTLIYSWLVRKNVLESIHSSTR